MPFTTSTLACQLAIHLYYSSSDIYSASVRRDYAQNILQPESFALLSYDGQRHIVLSQIVLSFETVLIRSGMLAEKVMQKENHVLSVDDLEQALELTDKEDIKEEKKLLEGIVRFGDETAKEIMTSRQDVIDLDFKSSFPEVLKCIVDNNYSRIPVYQDNIDNIRGILYIKDLLPHLGKPANFVGSRLSAHLISFPKRKRLTTCCVTFRKTRCI